MKIYIGGTSYHFSDMFTDKWNDAYYKTNREVDDEFWNKYKKLREEFYQMHEELEEKFVEFNDKKWKGK